MARVDDYSELEEKLLHLVRQGNREAFPFWSRLVMAETEEERAEVVADLRAHIIELIKQFHKEVFGDRTEPPLS